MSYYLLNKGFIAQKHQDKMMIFDGDESMLYMFNPSATFIFQKIRSGWEKRRILTELIKKYRIGKDKATADLNEFIRELLSKKIITYQRSGF